MSSSCPRAGVRWARAFAAAISSRAAIDVQMTARTAARGSPMPMPIASIDDQACLREAATIHDITQYL
jgi:hypothetical protein